MNTLLDMECAKKGYEISNSDINLLRKSLGVLQEDGVNAFFLYLKVNKGEDILKKLYNFFSEEQILNEILPNENNVEKIFENLRNNLAIDLNNLLFVKELLERTMIYAIYHSRSKPKNETSEETPKASITDEQGN